LLGIAAGTVVMVGKFVVTDCPSFTLLSDPGLWRHVRNGKGLTPDFGVTSELPGV
jgi:hypothetical protein